MMLDIQTILSSLSMKRSIFHSEADFQHSLAWEIQKKYPECKIRLETKIHGANTKVYLDILVISEDRKYAIELKYKTRSYDCVIDGEKFSLNNHGAQDIGRYDILKDIQRLEQMLSAEVVDEGIFILLTNDPSYYQNTGHKKQTVDRDFRINEGKNVSGQLSWGERTGKGTMKGREEPISLKGHYEMNWNNYSQIDNSGTGIFRSLILPVQDIEPTKEKEIPNEKVMNDQPKIKKIDSLSTVQQYETNKLPYWLNSFVKKELIPVSQKNFRDRISLHLNELGFSVQLNREFGNEKIDICATKDDQFFVIEVRYKTALLQTIYQNQHINLKKQGAQDISRYDYVSDLGKIERVVKSRPKMKGYAILLTNDRLYWQFPKKVTSIDEDFHIHDGNLITGVLSWREDASKGTTFGREESVCFKGSYKMQWASYLSLSEKKNGQFQILSVEVTSI